MKSALLVAPLLAALWACSGGSSNTDASTDTADAAADAAPDVPRDVSYISCMMAMNRATISDAGPETSVGDCRSPNDSCAGNDCRQAVNFGCTCGYDHFWTCGPQPFPPSCQDN